jgi:hypothetical protein
MNERKHFVGKFWYIAIGAVAVLALVFVFDPVRAGFYPPCLFHKLTGLHCPGCGSTRALHQLLHGNVSAALHLNPLAVLLLPVLGAGWWLHRKRRQILSPAWIWCLVIVVVTYGVARNLPVPPFNRLAPTSETTNNKGGASHEQWQTCRS